MAKWWQYVLNPLQLGIDAVRNLQGRLEQNMQHTEHGEGVEQHFGESPSITQVTPIKDFAQAVSGLKDDLTGVTAIKLQNDLNRQMAEEEYQRNLQSIGDTASAYEAAGFNRNLMYSASPASYSAPNLQEYSGSGRLDTILSRVGKVLGIIPAMYQATAALEGIDQARERTKQSEIKTMSDGLSLLQKGFGLSDTALTRPYGFTLKGLEGGKRHIFRDVYSGSLWRPYELGFTHDPGLSRRYMDAALKNQFDLLESIGISNRLRSTRNSYLGYQYDLDRRFGAAGRIVGMGAQGLRAVGGLFSPIKLGGFK